MKKIVYILLLLFFTIDCNNAVDNDKKKSVKVSSDDNKTIKRAKEFIENKKIKLFVVIRFKHTDIVILQEKDDYNTTYANFKTK